MKKIVTIVSLTFPIVIIFSFLGTFFLWHESKDIAKIITEQFLFEKNNWALNSLRGYDDGLMPSIRSTVINNLSKTFPMKEINSWKIEVYYGHVDDNNFYKAQKIDFNDFFNTDLIFWFTVGIFATKESSFYGHTFLERDYRPAWAFPEEQIIKLNNNKPLNNLNNLITSWNSLVGNNLVLDGFNHQLKDMGLDTSAGMELQKGQIKLNSNLEKYLEISDQFEPEKDNQIKVKWDMFEYVPEKLLASMWKFNQPEIMISTGATVEVKSSDFKKYEYAQIPGNNTLETKLQDILPAIEIYANDILEKTYDRPVDRKTYQIRFRKNGYSDPNLLDLNTKIGSLYTYTNSNKEKYHWVWIEFYDSLDTSFILDTAPGLHIGFNV
ncbi:hypothetical protein SSYRP_v1c08970 [Spiroplasma syrphidicola EA-1]|uniref:Uncharacterized protein n=1 Tax=Spiroplasma syrphidicola EA-1 TaxID=1276229 RepID=R4UML5_9MOLU|nr:hypothetical protein [Spiroplasma syrphidicola]AGM26486.1 hypothetical protein SSYRP_v1c08970 [Spiroplasma syrphidicola EA-1]